MLVTNIVFSVILMYFCCIGLFTCLNNKYAYTVQITKKIKFCIDEASVCLLLYPAKAFEQQDVKSYVPQVAHAKKTMLLH